MGVSISISIRENSQNISNNTSNVTVDVILSWGSGSYNNNKKPGYLYIDDSEYGFSANFNWNGASSSGSTTICTKTVDVLHESDGSKTLECSAWYQSGVSSGDVEASASKVLTKIPRASGIEKADDVSFGDSCSIKWAPLSSDMYNKIRFNLGEWEYTTGLFRPGTTGLYTYTGYKIPISAAVQIPNDTSGIMTATLYTYSDSNGRNQIGSAASKSFTVTIPDSIKPSITNSSSSIDNSENAVVSGWGVAVSGFSKVRLTASAEGIHGSRVVRYIIEGSIGASVDGSSLDYTSRIIDSQGEKTFRVSCVDSRGRVSNAVDVNPIVFLPYSIPTISQISVAKESNGRASVIAIFSCDSVGNHNSATGMLRYRKSGSSAWTNYGSITSGIKLVTTLLPSDDTSYYFSVVVTDRIGSSAENTAYLSTTQVLMDFRAGGKGLGIGKVCESDSLEIAFETKLMNEVYVGDKTLAEYIASFITDWSIRSRVYPVGSIYMSVNSTSPSSIFGGSWEQLKDRFLLGVGDVYYNGDTGGEAEHTLTVEEAPSHIHAMESPGCQYNLKTTAVVQWGGETNYWPIAHDNSEWNDGLMFSAGGDGAHNNMPPYLVVYMWKRVG